MNPDHVTYFSHLQELAQRSRDQLRLIPHNAEKGRALENVINKILLEILPRRFSLGTGFVINDRKETSSQQDIVIFDHIYNSPILSEAACSLYPVECVYGTIEVKSRLDRQSLEGAIKSIAKLRSIGAQRRYLIAEPVEKSGGELVYQPTPVSLTTPPRSYLVAFKRDGLGSSEEFRNTVAEMCEKFGAHIHGLCVLEENFFGCSVVGAKPSRFEQISDESALANLYVTILQNSIAFPIFAADMAQYLTNAPINANMLGSPSIRTDLEDFG